MGRTAHDNFHVRGGSARLMTQSVRLGNRFHGAINNLSHVIIQCNAVLQPGLAGLMNMDGKSTFSRIWPDSVALRVVR